MNLHAPIRVPGALQLVKMLDNAESLRSRKARGKPVDAFHGNRPDSTSKYLVRFLGWGHDGDTMALRVCVEQQRQPAGRGARHTLAYAAEVGTGCTGEASQRHTV